MIVQKKVLLLLVSREIEQLGVRPGLCQLATDIRRSHV